MFSVTRTSNESDGSLAWFQVLPSIGWADKERSLHPEKKMEISCCSCISNISIPFVLLQEVPLSMSTQRHTSGSRCNAASLKARGKESECTNVKFVGKNQHGSKLGLRSGGLNNNFRIAFNYLGSSCPIGCRSEILCCDAKSNLCGGLEEPFGDATDKTIFQDGKFSSLLGSSLNDGEVSAISSSEEITLNPSMVSSFQASASKMDSSASRVGVLITTGHFLLASGAVLLVDYHALKANPQSLAPFSLILSFLLSTGVTAILGFLFVPVLEYVKAAQVFRIEGPISHNAKSGTPTMGGLFFVPVGVAIAGLFTGFSNEIHGAMMSTLAFAGIGLLDDGLAFWRKHNYGLPGQIKLVMQVAVGISLFFWLEFTKLSYPHKTKHVLWLPEPCGLVYLGKWYLPLTAFCCAAMSNGVNLTDGLDGLAGGTAAVAFIAMSVAVLPLVPALGVFGSSMAGACFGFLVHNRYKAKVFMGDTGSLALGGALAAMACCTGMFFPLFVTSGVFVVETVSVVAQVGFFKLTKRLYGKGRRLFQMTPFHHHLELVGLKEPIIIIMAYSLSIALAILVVYLLLHGNLTKVSTS